MDKVLTARMKALCAEGWEVWDRFALEVRQHEFHPFVAADYEAVLTALLPHRAPGRRFLEWGSATGVITIMADMLGFDAYGIELDASLVATARTLATRFNSGAQFAAGSFLPAGYQFRPSDGDGRIGTIGSGPSGYLQIERPLEDFDVVFTFPWGGEEAMMLDVMKCYGRPDTTLLMNTVNDGVRVYRAGQMVASA
jgi:hypothetical protein